MLGYPGRCVRQGKRLDAKRGCRYNGAEVGAYRDLRVAARIGIVLTVQQRPYCLGKHLVGIVKLLGVIKLTPRIWVVSGGRIGAPLQEDWQLQLVVSTPDAPLSQAAKLDPLYIWLQLIDSRPSEIVRSSSKNTTSV